MQRQRDLLCPAKHAGTEVREVQLYSPGGAVELETFSKNIAIDGRSIIHAAA